MEIVVKPVSIRNFTTTWCASLIFNTTLKKENYNVLRNVIIRVYKGLSAASMQIRKIT